jgi:hypothetical protein
MASYLLVADHVYSGKCVLMPAPASSAAAGAARAAGAAAAAMAGLAGLRSLLWHFSSPAKKIHTSFLLSHCGSESIGFCELFMVETGTPSLLKHQGPWFLGCCWCSPL